MFELFSFESLLIAMDTSAILVSRVVGLRMFLGSVILNFFLRASVDFVAADLSVF